MANVSLQNQIFLQDLRREQRRGGYYWWVDGKPYISVTTILKVIDKPQLMYWFGKQVFLAMVADPTLNEREALAAPYQTSKKAADRGTTVHSIVEAYKKVGEIEVTSEFAPYARAFYRWMKEYSMELIENERTVKSDKYEYAGTLDILARNTVTGETYLIDVKTGKGIYDESSLQLSAYKQALSEEGKEIDRTAVLLLVPPKVDEDGKPLSTEVRYKFEECEPNLKAFLAAKYLWEWKNQEDWEKVKERALINA